LRISDRKDRDPQRRGEAGKITFQLYARFQRDAAPSRRSIGVYGAISLEKARRAAGEWKSLIAKGIDPAVVEAEAKAEAAQAAALRSQNTVAAVAEDWFAAKVRKERGGKDVERNFRTYFIAAWGDRPIHEITRVDVLTIINRKKGSAPPGRCSAPALSVIHNRT
jgi:Arm DNA-binding domain